MTPLVPDSVEARRSGQQPQVIDFALIAPQACPCGQTRRAFAAVESVPLTVHQVEIAVDAQLHYHKSLTEIYYILECSPGAQMQLDDQLVPLRPGMSVLIPPGVRHRAIGRMRVLNIVTPKFDPADEWFD
ncbi:MAG: cupin domain-containing protein [Planctomycetaceae bacterium]|nr:cupin domain-containing protein [Planctomycetaceae bacterium]